MDLRADERCEVETPFGPVWLFGAPTGRPTLLVLTGLFADAITMTKLADYFPRLDVLRAHLPGNHCPRLVACSVGVFGAAVSHAVRQVAAGPIGVLGMSAGGLVALAAKLPDLRGMVLYEPPLRSAGQTYFSRPDLISRDPELLMNLFGATEAGIVEPRDYTPLLAGLAVPTEALVGDLAFEGRGTPSLVDPATRGLLGRHPQVTLVEIAGVGHHVSRDAPREITSGALWRLGARIAAPAASS
jgi:pimeloyl-ACP methyl ester carboxylesterase